MMLLLPPPLPLLLLLACIVHTAVQDSLGLSKDTRAQLYSIQPC